VLAVPPLTLNVAESPGQIVEEFTLIVAEELIVTIATALPVQPFSEAVTV
jgi:hypothetical protein